MKKMMVVAALLLSMPAFSADVAPIPASVKVNAAKAALGEKLYNDTLLSGDGTVSCATCHALNKGGTDRMEVSKGIKGQKGGMNSPTVFNSEHNFVQFWDGRAKDLKAQALGPVANPLEMGETWPNVVKKVAANKDYAKAFGEVYGGKITKENIADAIAEFERTLITPNSRFDQFLKGDKKALTPIEQKGWALFQEKGCQVCHSGTYFGGQAFQQVSPEYFKRRGGAIKKEDLGRYNVTKKEEDKHKFKVPSLRNVAATAPYFHDGKVKSLDQAVKLMAKLQLGQDLQPSELRAIVAFLKTLSGEYNGTPVDAMR